MKNYAILIAAQEHADPAIGSVAYARRDAEKLAAALALHGFDKAGQLLLLDAQSTKQAIESGLRDIVDRLESDDTLYFYYAGFAFSQAERNYLTCHDTQATDLAATSLALEPLLAELATAQCGRLVLFFDFRSSESRAALAADADCESFHEVELAELVDNAPNCVGFVACRASESSHSSGALQHGIWTYHLIQALQADAPLALERGLLTAESLQKYLGREVPRTLRKTLSGADNQTPWMTGAASGDCVLADMHELLRQRRAAKNKAGMQVAGLSFVIAAEQRLKSLSGWKNSFRIPDRYSDSADQFAKGLAETELRKDLDSVYAKLKQAFGFTRRDLDAAEPLDGTGTIITPHFNYTVNVSLDGENLDAVIWTRTVEAIKTPKQITSPAFGRVFDGVFSALQYSLPAPISVEDFIDAVEVAKISGLALNYDRECTYCQLHLPGLASTVTLKAQSLAVVHVHPRSTQELIESFETVRKLISKHGMPLV